MRRFLTRYLCVALAGVLPGLSSRASAQTPSPSSAPTSPLALHVGDADLLIGGFMEMTAVTRSTATGNGLGTNL